MEKERGRKRRERKREENDEGKVKILPRGPQAELSALSPPNSPPFLRQSSHPSALTLSFLFRPVAAGRISSLNLPIYSPITQFVLNSFAASLRRRSSQERRGSL
jgi:hypothetical protein